ncbi:MAG: fused MFS/spermidine synthase [Pseudonocardiales bacterium]
MVEPMVAKLVLPLFGGSPSVWNTSIFFFQVTLLAGYLVTHLTIRRLGVRRQMWLQLGLLMLPLAVLPLALPANADPRAGAPAVVWLLYVLVMAVGAPFLMLGTAGPLLQRWFGGTSHPRATDPYFLFAAGNAGSLLALCAYPTAIEPYLTLHRQRLVWSAGYVVFVLLSIGCVLLMRGRLTGDGPVEPRAETPAPPLTGRRRLRWVALAFLPASMMLGTTTYITTDIAPIPLLWVVPLSVYLVTFIVAFAVSPAAAATISRRLAAALAGLAVPAGLSAVGLLPMPTLLAVALQLATFALVALTAHCALAADRPAVSQLTSFYLLVASGGALGGAFNGLIAPVVFNRLYEYPMVIAAAMFLYAGAGRAGWLRRRLPSVRAPIAALVAGAAPLALGLAAAAGVPGRGRLPVAAATVILLGALALVAARRLPAAFAIGLLVMLVGVATQGKSLLVERTFFGVQKVDVQAGDRHVLTNGRTVHGIQDFRGGNRLQPLSYYHPDGPAGDVFRAYPGAKRDARVAVIGLGAGSLAAYGRAGQRFTFYELDPATVAIARDQRLFTYLRDSRAAVDVVVGDGRLSIARASPAEYDLVVVDAFSSDAIPVHLLTSEAVALYASRLRPGGWLVVHISNRHLNLAPVVANIARVRGMSAAIRIDERSKLSAGKAPSTWVALSHDPADLAPLMATGRWADLASWRTGAPAWTDDFSNLFGVLKWGS